MFTHSESERRETEIYYLSQRCCVGDRRDYKNNAQVVDFAIIFSQIIIIIISNDNSKYKKNLEII